jgi:hypothetical protein
MTEVVICRVCRVKDFYAIRDCPKLFPTPCRKCYIPTALMIMFPTTDPILWFCPKHAHNLMHQFRSYMTFTNITPWGMTLCAFCSRRTHWHLRGMFTLPSEIITLQPAYRQYQNTVLEFSVNLCQYHTLMLVDENLLIQQLKGENICPT